jgi:hypothetical protein
MEGHPRSRGVDGELSCQPRCFPAWLWTTLAYWLWTEVANLGIESESKWLRFNRGGASPSCLCVAIVERFPRRTSEA